MPKIVMVDCVVKNSGTVFASNGPGFDVEVKNSKFINNESFVAFDRALLASSNAASSNSSNAPVAAKAARFAEGVSLNAIGSFLGSIASVAITGSK